MKMKKQRTPEEKIKRGKYALYLVLFMIAVVFLSGILHKDDANQPDRLDVLLDSIIVKDYPEGTVVLNKSYVEEIIAKSPEQDSLEKIRLEYEKTMNRNIIEKRIDTTETGRMRREIKRLEKIVKNEDKSKLQHNISRAVNFQTPDGTVMSAYLWADSELKKAEFIYVTENLTNADSLGKAAALEIEEQIKNQ